jgi:hypothetical protein
MDGACNACVVMSGCGCERVLSVALADMACVYVDLHDAAGGNVCGVSGRGCGGGCWGRTSAGTYDTAVADCCASRIGRVCGTWGRMRDAWMGRAMRVWS